MKFHFNLKNKEASFESDIEKLVEMNLDIKSKKPDKKTHYQIKQEEKRKNLELKHRQQMVGIYMLLGIVVVLMIFGVIVSTLSI